MKTLIINRFKELSILLMLSLTSIVLLAMRIKITHDFYMLFLVWNLFLAILPYVISLWLETSIASTYYKRTHKWLTIPIFTIWLLILPNAPYIITDLIHIRNASGAFLIYDSILIASFAITGCWAGFMSLHQMINSLSSMHIIKREVHKTVLPYLILFLSAIGIYLGRDLRWNSWDIIQQPAKLFTDTLSIFMHPLTHQTAWLQIIPMSLFLMVLYKLFLQHETKY
ncbi:DUF1361 domain-containing protein [Nonlabens ulvanivorans]|uniref:Membrane protein n=1 Tax=Nonlabens ulvanivorans TaxID=906888 RepID=A0ABX5E492_NONUL|nr:DUF1361 domain-containing protein [Nonlabens ulvanivorans]PRX12239.1 putative membrane protein [Nonlabens ulvanivorans]